MTIATSIAFTDAYTGESAPVVMRISPDGVPGFCAPSAVSPREIRASMDDARRALGPDLVCPYTGECLRPVFVEGSVMFAGGWDPRRPAPRQEFLHYASMRAGRTDVPPETGRVEPARDDPPPPLSHETPVTQEAIDMVKSVTERKSRRRSRR